MAVDNLVSPASRSMEKVAETIFKTHQLCTWIWYFTRYNLEVSSENAPSKQMMIYHGIKKMKIKT